MTATAAPFHLDSEARARMPPAAEIDEFFAAAEKAQAGGGAAGAPQVPRWLRVDHGVPRRSLPPLLLVGVKFLF